MQALAVSAGGLIPPPPQQRGLRFTGNCRRAKRLSVWAGQFPAFLPIEVQNIKDPQARKLASRIERLPVSFSEGCIMSSCVMPVEQSGENPVVLLHGFDSSLLEWRYVFPMLEEAGLETWAIDIVGWGFSDLERLPACDVTSKRDHLYQVLISYMEYLLVHFMLIFVSVLESIYQKANDIGWAKSWICSCYRLFYQLSTSCG
ncbi:unnamed protein product [Cuscuta epithymum]|uniref:AB hydrolase-1 domain-containing protein n=1 Tax=Cuscuta epithymum TaxID=186058 RepID=A0AAV0CNY0_9ASTE|nr:unnamed protein product [Cuscuta epithymum]